MNKLTISDGQKICKLIYETIGDCGFYPALTGGVLYKNGNRKDVDIVIFRNRQDVNAFEIIDLEGVLTDVGFYDFNHYGFVTKCKYNGIDVDLFNPETISDDNYGDENE